MNTKALTRSALLLALAVAIQVFRLPQPFTGPIVNTILFLAVLMVSPGSAILIGLCTPLIAFFFGLMPIPVVVPVIMLANAALAFSFSRLQTKPYLGIAVAALAKYLVLYVGVTMLLPLFLAKALPAKIVYALTTPQLFTALVGGLLALVLWKALHWVKKEGNVG